MRPTHSFVWFSLISAACAATPAAAQPSAACTLSGTSHADTVLNPAIGEDDAFLGSRSRGLPTVAFVLDTSDHMRRFPYDLTSQGVRSQGLKCANTLLNDLVYESNPCVDGKGQAVSPAPAGCDSVTHKPAGWGLGYQRTASGASVLRTYPAYDRDIPGLFSSTRYYVHDLGWGVNSTNVANANVYTTAALACAAGASGEEGECTSCVVSSGYYLPTSATARPVLAGNWINFYPPKYVVARKVLKDQFAALDFPSRNRMTMLTMSDTDRARCYSQRLDGTGMDANRDGARLIGNPTRFKPPCNQFAACMHNGSSGGGRSAFDNQVNGQNTLFTGPPTPCPNGVALPSSAPPGAQSVAMVPGSDGVCRGEYRDNSSARLGDAICAPYAESLLNAGQYLGDERLYDSLFPSSPAGHWRKPDFDLADGVCGASSCGCPRPVVIMIAGGSPDFD
ncbi:MAG TPA: hypothetical protein VEY30_05370, partial [Myxococcaceae bacterium]|nr:hypothetical protein [Myxococcaceae bacterium]